jgi:YtkA-like
MRRTVYLLFALLGACGGGMGDDGDDDTPVNCALETRDDDFGIGLTKTGDSNMLQFTLRDAVPAPPIRGDNTWVIEVASTGVAGAPVDGADIVATPFMPDHGHPSAKTVKIEAMPEAGQYQLSPVNFWMPGLWETTLEVTSPGGNDAVVFRFCIPS